MEFIANTNYIREIDSSSVSGVINEGLILPSEKMKAVGAEVLTDGYQVIITAITDSSTGATIPDPGPYTATFNASSTKNKAEGNFVLREGDETNTINATPQIPGTPPTPSPVSFKVKITAAGQQKVRGN